MLRFRIIKQSDFSIVDSRNILNDAVILLREIIAQEGSAIGTYAIIDATNPNYFLPDEEL